jgi:hypothetical protein
VHVHDPVGAGARRLGAHTRLPTRAEEHGTVIAVVLRRVALAFALVVVAASGACAADARAGTYIYCDAEVYSGQVCPDESSAAGERHTFKNQVGNWGTVEHPGCDLNIFIVADHAPTTTTNGSPKYYTSMCNTAVLSFPNNTQLLREYASYSCYCNSTHLLYGYGDFY